MVIDAALDLHMNHRNEYYPPHMALLVGDRDEDRQCARPASIDFQLAADWRADEALVLFDKAHALNPADPQILNGRGTLMLELNRPADALASFEQALAVAPKGLNTRLNRGTALAQARADFVVIKPSVQVIRECESAPHPA